MTVKCLSYGSEFLFKYHYLVEAKFMSYDIPYEKREEKGRIFLAVNMVNIGLALNVLTSTEDFTEVIIY